MPITASENPVLIPRPLSSKAITITWATGDSTLGRVFEVRGTAEVLFDDGGSAGGARSGSKQRTFTVGETVLFRLRRAAASSTILATLTVTAQRAVSILDVIGASPVGVNILGSFQFIYDLRVLPGLDYVDFSFRTSQPTVPLVNLTLDAPDAPPGTAVTFAFPLFKGMQTEHEIRVGNPPRLEQDTTYFYKIIATGTGRRGDAVVRGTFTTGSQDAELFFDRIHVRRDGDPNSAGDFTFYFGAGDAETKDELGLPWPTYSADISDGQSVLVGRSIHIPRAPRRLWVGVVGVDDDSYIFAPLCTLGHRPAPTGPRTDHAEQEACEQAWVWDEFDTFENGEFKSGLRNYPFTLSTGNFGVAFDVSGGLRVSAVAGASFQMRMPKGAVSPVATLREPGRGAAIAMGRDGVLMAALGPDGAIYYKPISVQRPALPRGQWMRLDGPIGGAVTVVASRSGAANFFAVGREGGVLHTRCAEDGEPGREWDNLGGAPLGPVAADVSPQGQVELFIVGEEGMVLHRSWEEETTQGYTDWKSLGGPVRGSLAPLSLPGGGLGLFALGCDGSVLHKRRRGREWTDAGAWDSLGGSFAGELGVTRQDDGALLVFVVTEDRRIFVKTWAGYPDTPPPEPWEEAGTIDSLFERQMVRLSTEAAPATLEAAAG
jgi:hypothetical protein